MIETREHRAESPNTNAYLERECVHVRDGAQSIDVVRLVTVGAPPPLTYRYQKGPDEIAVCAACALEVFALLMRQCGRERYVKLPSDDGARPYREGGALAPEAEASEALATPRGPL